MNPMLKKVLGALAVKEIIDRIQEARKPKKGFFARVRSLVVPAAIVGGGYYLYRNGKLDPLIEQAKGYLNQSEEELYTPPAPSASTV